MSEFRGFAQQQNNQQQQQQNYAGGFSMDFGMNPMMPNQQQRGPPPA